MSALAPAPRNFHNASLVLNACSLAWLVSPYPRPTEEVLQTLRPQLGALMDSEALKIGVQVGALIVSLPSPPHPNPASHPHPRPLFLGLGTS